MNPKILVLRIQNLLKTHSKTQKPQPSQLQFGVLRLDLVQYEVYLNDNLIDIAQSDFKLLAYLAQYADQILSRDQIYKAVKGIEYNGYDRAIDTQISHLRKILGDTANNPTTIKTIWDKGYIFCSNAWN